MNLPLSAIQIRVLACLFEKQYTTPDQYPLTLNALKNACNQKSNRNPVANYYEGELGKALNDLETMQLVRMEWSGRTQKYKQRLPQILDIQHPAASILTTLMLRGPQTGAEIRSHCQRLHAFDDMDDVEYQLTRLTEHEPSLVMQLPRQPGQKEQRYVQLLTGEPDIEALAAAMPVRSQAGSQAVANSALEERVCELEKQVEQLMADLNART